MGEKQARNLVKQYISIVTKQMDVNKVVLYGSYARGNFNKESDIDVAVIVSRDSISDDIINEKAKLFKLRRNISYDIEPVLLIDEDDESGFLEHILSYGEIMYSK